MRGNQIINHAMPHFIDDRPDALFRHEFTTLFENDLALVIHHIIIFQNILPHVEIARLDFLLRLLDCLVDPRMNNRLVFLQTQLLQHAVHPVGAENPHQIVLQRQEEFRLPRIPLPAGTPTQLVINPAAFVPLGAHNIKPACRQRQLLELRHFRTDLRLGHCPLCRIVHIHQFVADAHIGIAAQLDIGAAPCHIRCNRNCAGHTGLRDDKRLLLMETCIQHSERL